MSTYTCPHCGQHDLSTQRRHNCPKLPSLSIPLGPPRSMDPCANEYIARLTRELEGARTAFAAAMEYVHESHHADIVATLEAKGIDLDALATPELGGEGGTLESRAYDIAHWIATEARVAESLDRSVAPIESEGARRIVALASARRGEGGGE